MFSSHIYFVKLPSVCLELFLSNCECSLAFSGNENFESSGSAFDSCNFFWKILKSYIYSKYIQLQGFMRSLTLCACAWLKKPVRIILIWFLNDRNTLVGLNYPRWIQVYCYCTSYLFRIYLLILFCNSHGLLTL